eukprot:TRINITY_DN73567_c0_g1_i1.p1 TRINITY_DN73567_c0_g1~~TRINITY_DN73567_c0_g1_i1.p1  ORF type:complete len:645 (-),score=92.35 TRINITY_DN73567_c0_g1_i1:468-2402(-)
MHHALCLLLAFVIWICQGALNSPEVQELISSRQQLNDALERGPNRRMGFLSKANFNSVHTVLNKKVEPVYFADTEKIYQAVESGDVIAALISGMPNSSRVMTFPSDLISPRSFQMKPGPDSEHLMQAVDAAVVRTHYHGELLKAQLANPPFEAVEVHTCRADNPEQVPFPEAATATGLLRDIIQTKKLKILASGNATDLPNWHQDGNYEVTPPTGFWPEYMDYFMKHFRNAYGDDIELERVWMTSGGTDMVLSGAIHMTEPYYIYENLHNNEPKKWNHKFSCVVMGYEQQFLSRLIPVQTITDGNLDSCPAKLARCEEARRISEIKSRQALNEKLESGPNRKMGFLSEANYRSVAPVLSDKIEPVYYTHSSEIFDAVFSGSVIAGLISGVPDRSNFSVFSSDMISPRSFQMMPGVASRDLMEAVDAAVVRTHNAGEILKATQANPPFEAAEVHTCRASDPEKVPFPSASKATGLLKDVLDNKRLKVLSYGSPSSLPNWQQDGNYQVRPHTGFWPDYMDMWMAHFKAAYGNDIVLERVWMTSGGTQMVLNGTIHMTEPYYVYENLWTDRPKKWSHEFSCVVLGYEQQFFAQKAVLDFSAAGLGCENQLTSCENPVKPVDLDLGIRFRPFMSFVLFLALGTVAACL